MKTLMKQVAKPQRMKTFIAGLCAVVLAFTVAVPAAKASTPSQAIQAVADLRSLTQVLPVTKASETTKIRRDLIKHLDSANTFLIRAGQASNSTDAVQLYYRAAREVWSYGNRLGKLCSSGKVGQAEGNILLGMGYNTQVCIIEIYYPDYQ